MPVCSVLNRAVRVKRNRGHLKTLSELTFKNPVGTGQKNTN